MAKLPTLVIHALLVVSTAVAYPILDAKEDLIANELVPESSSDGDFVEDDLPGIKIADKGALFGLGAMNTLSNSNSNETYCVGPNQQACYCSLFSDNRMAGGYAGVWFSRGAGRFPIKRIGVWAGDAYIYRIQIWFFDGSHYSYGQSGGTFKKISFYATERITAMSVWGSANRVGAIKIVTSRGQSFAHGMTSKWEASKEVKMNCGSGIMMNVFGKMDWGAGILYSLGFDFMQTYVQGSATIGQLAYQGLSSAPLQPKMNLITKTNYENSADFTQKFTFSGSVEVSVSNQWHIFRFMRFSPSYHVSGGPPELKQQKGTTARWEVGQTGHFSASVLTSEDRGYNVVITVPPHKKFHAEAWLSSDEIQVDFNCAMVFKLTTNAQYTLNSWGTYTGRTYRKVTVKAYEYH
ncbi:hypothetical protein BSKO_10814 [Bryopsis sp. KO-2023]|nr:hypothetical protein BSKO_10814 [Bryopsis sp. KO-2023]